MISVLINNCSIVYLKISRLSWFGYIGDNLRTVHESVISFLSLTIRKSLTRWPGLISNSLAVLKRKIRDSWIMLERPMRAVPTTLLGAILHYYAIHCRSSLVVHSHCSCRRLSATCHLRLHLVANSWTICAEYFSFWYRVLLQFKEHWKEFPVLTGNSRQNIQTIWLWPVWLAVDDCLKCLHKLQLTSIKLMTVISKFSLKFSLETDTCKYVTSRTIIVWWCSCQNWWQGETFWHVYRGIV